MKTLLVLLFTFLIVTGLFSDESALDYYPIHVGDYWNQHTDSINGGYNPATFRQEFEGTDLIFGEVYYRRSNWLKADDNSFESRWYTWVRSEPTGIVLGALGESSDVDLATKHNPPLQWLPNEILNLGHAWEFDFPPSGHYSMSVVGISENVSVPAGDFSNCIKLKLVITNISSESNDTTQTNYYYLAKGVGEVLNAGWSTGQGNFKFELVNSSVVPVELSSFNASVGEGCIHLEWITQTETNNYGFEVERLIYSDWQTIGFEEGYGTTTEPHAYRFTDNLSNISPDVSVVRYRLKQIDTDGSFEYSRILNVSLSIPNVPRLFQNYPNPFNPSTRISYSIPIPGFVTLEVFDTLGKEIQTLVSEFQEGGAYSFEFDGSRLSSGIYFCKLQAGNLVVTKKMLLMQ